jgi:hypothetical protein
MKAALQETKRGGILMAMTLTKKPSTVKQRLSHEPRGRFRQKTTNTP